MTFPFSWWKFNASYEWREANYPGLADVNNIYYSLPAADRKAFIAGYPELDDYQQANEKYRKAHPAADSFLYLRSDYYTIKECENACAAFDKQTMQELQRAALAGEMPEDYYQPLIEATMREIGSTKDYKYFVKDVMKYIVGY